ncbi:hypothetical protein D1872_278700 [compost metagenome]
MSPSLTACRILPNIKTGKFGAIAAINVPDANRHMAVINSLLVENVSIRKAETGINTPVTSMNPVVNH